eukprot:TRINITY_DN62867_c0_g2_i1.p1 TRINITY_DN62867_c0_g2~~TRINITY_DN62867_c0_g2_i1.p1  ORF type:complete len:287 (-),score=26.44 TRINITY_DN62867_c0_g2_i1:184-1044(-)
MAAAAPAPPQPAQATGNGGAGNRVVGCGVGGCTCQTYVIGTVRGWPASSAVACGRPSCGHTWHSHLTGNGGAPAVVPNPHPAGQGVYSYYLADSVRPVAGAGVRQLDIGNSNNGQFHMSWGMKGASETGDDPLLDDSAHQQNLVSLSTQLEEQAIRDMDPVKRALRRYEANHTSDNFMLTEAVIHSCVMYKHAELGRKEDDEDVTDLERESVKQHGDTILFDAQELLKEVCEHEDHESFKQDTEVLEWMISNFKMGHSEPGMNMLHAITANLACDWCAGWVALPLG